MSVGGSRATARHPQLWLIMVARHPQLWLIMVTRVAGAALAY